VAILSARSPRKESAVLGPFVIAGHKPGSYLLLRHNPHYWKKDSAGFQLPYLDSIRLDIQQNREIELLRFQRGQVDLIDSLEPDAFERLASAHAAVQDVGPSLEAELVWFNQVARAPLPDYKAWFRSRNFRRALSQAINRQDLCRVVYHGYAHPGVGPFSAANRFWFNARLRPPAYDPAAALRRLAADGFHRAGERLLDRDGHPVEFSLITNAGNRVRERLAAMTQQDLRKIGVQLNIVTLDFPSLIERISRTFQYEACLLGLINVDLDPNAQMNVWLSSGPQHQWNPGQPRPETPWEAEIDKLMRAQASTLDPKKRKACFDRVQEIVSDDAPFLYLANKDALVAVSPGLRNVSPSVLRPQLLWNAEWLSWGRARGPDREMSRPEPLLSCCLTAGYAGKPRILKEARLEVYAHEVLGLAGPSGSGKSTISLAILRLLGGACRVEGSIRLCGRELTRLNERGMRQIRGREIALVLQSPLSALNPVLSIGTQLREAWRSHARTDSRTESDRIRELLEDVQLPSEASFLRRYPRQLSVGQAQRVLIAMALLHRPKLLIADEPTSALDPVTQGEVLELFVRLNQRLRMAILFISHDLRSLAALCHRVAVLYQGEIVECGETSRVFTAPSHPYTRQLLAPINLGFPASRHDDAMAGCRA
jgi:ABC-type dipeptide/oligopeptide/nickel transport system ATPase component